MDQVHHCSRPRRAASVSARHCWRVSSARLNDFGLRNELPERLDNNLIIGPDGRMLARSLGLARSPRAPFPFHLPLSSHQIIPSRGAHITTPRLLRTITHASRSPTRQIRLALLPASRAGRPTGRTGGRLANRFERSPSRRAPTRSRAAPADRSRVNLTRQFALPLKQLVRAGPLVAFDRSTAGTLLPLRGRRCCPVGAEERAAAN
jgi:hypothetical protein